jgi:hypothetical protein
LVKELNFAGGLDENPYKHLQDFEEICATLMISRMNHETLKWKAFLFSLMGWAKQWYKLYVSSCHGSWVILKDQLCFSFFLLSKIIDLHNDVLNFAQKEGESLGAAWSRYNQLVFLGSELSILDAMFMHNFVHGLGTESAEYLDMTSGGVFVHCTVEEGNLILDRILSVTPLEDLQFKAPLISEDELIITYLDTSDISALPAMEELLQLTAPGIGSENKIEDPTPFPLLIKEDCFDDDIENLSKAPTYNLKGLKFKPAGQDLEELLASKENLLKLSAIISRNWSIVVEEDGSYIRIYPDAKAVCCFLQGFLFWIVCYDPRVGLNIFLLDEASGIDMWPLITSTKILQWQSGQNLQCKGVVPITTTIEGSKICLDYHIFHHPGPPFILVGVPLRAFLSGTDNGEFLKMAVGCQEFLTSFARAINHAVDDELEGDLLQQVMATTLEEELSPPCLDGVADYFSVAEEEVEFQDLGKRSSLKPLLLNSNSCHWDFNMSS